MNSLFSNINLNLRDYALQVHDGVVKVKRFSLPLALLSTLSLGVWSDPEVLSLLEYIQALLKINNFSLSRIREVVVNEIATLKENELSNPLLLKKVEIVNAFLSTARYEKIELHLQPGQSGSKQEGYSWKTIALVSAIGLLLFVGVASFLSSTSVNTQELPQFKMEFDGKFKFGIFEKLPGEVVWLDQTSFGRIDALKLFSYKDPNVIAIVIPYSMRDVFQVPKRDLGYEYYYFKD